MEQQRIVMTTDYYTMAGVKNVSLELTQKAERYEVLPDGGDTSMWEHYRPGTREWSVSHGGLYCKEMDAGPNDSIIIDEGMQFKAFVEIGEKVTVMGDVALQEVEMDAENGSLAKYRGKVVGMNFPSLTRKEDEV